MEILDKKVHSNSQDLYNYIADWIYKDFYFSKNDKWNRMGFLGVFGDYVLSCTKGDILEIGCGESSIYLSALARKFNRRIYHCDSGGGKIDNPLTIPGYIDAPNSIYFKCSSDEMFTKNKLSVIALSFIDGDHNYKQVKKDFYNVLERIVNDGYIILHDTYPKSEEYINENKCGDVYKFRQEIEQDNRFDILTLPRGAAMDVGLTIIRKKDSENLKFFQK